MAKKEPPEKADYGVSGFGSWQEVPEAIKRRIANEELFKLWDGVKKKYPGVPEENIRPLMELHIRGMAAKIEDDMRRLGKTDNRLEQHEYMGLLLKLHREGEARRRIGEPHHMGGGPHRGEAHKAPKPEKPK